MKTPIRFLLALSLLLTVTPHLGAAELTGKPQSCTTPGQVPEGLAAGEWKALRAAHEAARHAVMVAADGTLSARNFGQQWRSTFDEHGFLITPDAGDWKWGMELRSYGFSGAEQALGPVDKAAIAHEQGRINRQRDPILREWFVNDARGLEQGWTLTRRPPGARDGAPLRLTLSVRGGLAPQVARDGNSVAFAQDPGATLLNYGGLKAWDADGRTLAARFEAVAGEVQVLVEEAAARYPLTIDPLVYQAYLKASNTGAGDGFGVSVAISGDTVIVGAGNEASNASGVNGNQDDNSALGSGAAYVFVRNGGIWSQQAYLKASNTGANDGFGGWVAISGDTVVVGAYLEDSSATGVNGNQADNSAIDSGAAYVFVRTGTTWSQQAYLKASNAAAGDNFGRSVAISGNSVVVGASLEDSNATGVNGNQADNSTVDSGAAYVFVRTGTTWSQQAYLKASNTRAGDSFGFIGGVAISGDTVVVGALNEASNATGVNGNQADNSAAGAGAAYVFVRTGSTWGQQAYLKASNTGAGDKFGRAVAVSGDTVVVGAYAEDSGATGVNGNQADNSATDSGAAYMFVRTGTTWSQQAYLKASNTAAGDNFARSVAVSGDTVVVGALGEDSNATGINGSQTDNSALNSGAAYVFVRSGGSWSQQAYLKASYTEANDNFGNSVAVAGDTVVVGASQEDSSATEVNGNFYDNSAPNSGAAYVFHVATVPPNDAFAFRSNLGTVAAVAATGNLELASSESTLGEPDLSQFAAWGFQNDYTVWYDWTAPAGMQWVRLELLGPAMPVTLSVYVGSALSSLTRMTLARAGAWPVANSLTFQVSAGTTYHIRLAASPYDFGSTTGPIPDLNYSLSLQALGTPVTALDFVLRGRAWLERQTQAGLVNALADFNAAISLNPASEEAHFLRAITKLLNLEAEPSFETLLDSYGAFRSGLLRGGGQIFPPTDSDGNLSLMPGSSTGPMIDWITNQMLPRFAEIRADLDLVAGNSFRTSLSARELGGMGTLVDKGDVLVLKAVTHGLDLFFNLLFTYDLNVSLESVMALSDTGQLDAQHLLATSASLLKFAASDRRPQFAAALRAMEADYRAASDFIRNLRGDATGLLTADLTYDPDVDAKARDTLATAVASLDGEVTCQGTRVNLSRLMVTHMALRNWLPEFRGGAVLTGTIPDPTFDGILPGMTQSQAEERLMDLGRLWGMAQYAEEYAAILRQMKLPSGPSDDADHDGNSNLQEWLHGANPAVANVLWQNFTRKVLVPGQPDVRISFTRRKDLRDWKLLVAVSDDLIAWDRSETQIAAVGTPVDNGDGWSETVTYQLTAAAAVAKRKFMRVEALPK